LVKVLNLPKESVVKAVKRGKVAIAVVGLGYVGLPLATLFAEEGAQVIGCDINSEVVRLVKEGRSHIVEHDISWLLQEGAKTLDNTCPNCGVRLFSLKREAFCPTCGRIAIISQHGVRLYDKLSNAHKMMVGRRVSLEKLLKKVVKAGRLRATTDIPSAAKEADVDLICVGTPLKSDNTPDNTALVSACSSVGKGLKKGDLVIVKSTVSPGTTESVVKPILEGESGLKAGVDFGLAHVPERIKEGHAIFEFRTIPRIAGGIDRRSGGAAAAVFSIFPAPVYVFNNPRITETSKLFENIYRDVNIALVNELAMICEKIGVNVIEAISAANTDPKTHLLTPGPGVGGYCLPKDPYYLIHPSINAGYKPSLIPLARQINDAMASHVVELVEDAFAEMKTPIKGVKIAVLGISFKGNSGDLRNTPATPIIKKLLELGGDVIAHDPFASFNEISQTFPKLSCTRKIEEALRNARCAVIVTDHLEYGRLEPSEMIKLMGKPAAIVDARHMMEPEEAVQTGFIYRGVGIPQ